MTEVVAYRTASTETLDTEMVDRVHRADVTDFFGQPVGVIHHI